MANNPYSNMTWSTTLEEYKGERARGYNRNSCPLKSKSLSQASLQQETSCNQPRSSSCARSCKGFSTTMGSLTV